MCIYLILWICKQPARPGLTHLMFKLSRTIRGHDGDVKAVKFGKNSVFSCSRDGTVRSDDTVLLEVGFYLNSLAVDESATYCGGQDGSISQVLLESSKTFYLLGHTANVCALDLRGSSLISGSWDKTARIWDTQDIANAKLVLKGHTEAVWAVLCLEDGFLTGSADKSIIHWDKSGRQTRVFRGHTDAVRGLTLLDATTFASCSNDGTVKVWSLDGTLLHTLQGHTSFVYSVSASPKYLFSSGEDRTVRVWSRSSFEVVQVITFPCVSIWSVDAQEDKFAVGSSDYCVRVFSTKDWSKEEQNKFLEAVANSAVGEDQVGKIDESQLADPKVLEKPGKEGQVVMVKQRGAIIAYQFSNEWLKVGEVVGKSSDGAKQQYNGKEYDYVFDVDIREGAPPLKLPFNNTDNPYLVAEKFVSDNELSPDYVEQVVRFLIANSECNRLDNSSTPQPPAPDQIPPLFNYTKLLSMTSFQEAALIKAYNEAEKKYGDASVNIESLIRSLPSSSSQLLAVTMQSANKWEIDDMLPALDALRLAVPVVDKLPFVTIITLLMRCLDPEVPKHAMLATRALANLTSRKDAPEIVTKNTQVFKEGLQMLCEFKEFIKPMQVAVATVLLNLVVDNYSGDIAGYIVKFSDKISDPEASYRLGLAAGVRAVRMPSDKPALKKLQPWFQKGTEPRFKELAKAFNSVV